MFWVVLPPPNKPPAGFGVVVFAPPKRPPVAPAVPVVPDAAVDVVLVLDAPPLRIFVSVARQGDDS